MVGETFGSLFVRERFGTHPKTRAWLWLCSCACGNEVISTTTKLRTSLQPACRVCITQARVGLVTTHGGTASTTRGKRCDRLYKVWESMRARCENPSHKAFRFYGAKGVTVCQEWQDYAVFRAWAVANGYVEGQVPEPSMDRPSIDRVDSSGNYCPENCRFIPWIINSLRGLSTVHGREIHRVH